MSGLRIGDRVRTPDGVEVVVSRTSDTVCTFDTRDAPSWWDPGEVEPLPADIPRERVEALLADVEKQTAKLDPSPHNRFAAEVRRELTTVMTRMREMLETTDGE